MALPHSPEFEGAFFKLYVLQKFGLSLHVLLWHYGAIPCNQGDVKHLKL